MTSKIRACCLLVTILFFAGTALCQDCEQSLTDATSDFEAGRFYGIPSLLKDCLEKGFSEDQKVRAYLLLTQVYLVVNDPIAAEDSYLRLLKTDPEYVASPTRDAIDVFYLSKKFTTTPKFTPHFFQLGSNLSRQRTIQSISTSPIPVTDKKLYVPGFQAGLGVDWNLSNHVSIGGDVIYSLKNFSQQQDGFAYADKLTITEKQTYVDVPIYIKYSSDSGRIRPFLYAGVAANFLLSSNASLEFVNAYTKQSEQSGQQVPSVGPDEKFTYRRHFFNRSFVFGGGLKYKIGRNFIYVDARYMAGINNLTKASTNYYEQDNKTLANTITQYQYASDFFRLDNVSLSFGYIKPLYDPRKKGVTPIRSLLNRVLKHKTKATK
jgi:hypothetical protein